MPPRSAWLWAETWPATDDDVESQLFVRQVGDGVLTGLVSLSDEVGWSCSVSHVASGASRYPTWEEVLDVRLQLLPRGIDFVAHVLGAIDDNISSLHMQQHPSPGGSIER
jgi:hypothetical protein